MTVQEVKVSENSQNISIAGEKPALKRRLPIDIPARVDYLIGQITAELKKLGHEGVVLNKATQEELASIINLLQSIEKRFIYNAVKNLKDCDARQEQLAAKLDFIQIAIDALLQKQPNTCLAKRIRRNIQYSIDETDNPIGGFWKNSLLKIVHLGSTPNKLMVGLFMALPLYLGIGFSSVFVINYLSQFVGNIPPGSSVNGQSKVNMIMSREDLNTLVLLALVGSAGALGSIISILTRIEEYQNKDYDDSILPIVIGACKPLIGASFGILLFTISCSTISPLQITQNANQQNTKGFTFFSLAFIVGFSERFAKDIISRTESSMSGSSVTDKSKD
ncbi:MAG TPA: hypothetical protein IGS40_16895 [Trichormus sp. M33_DOE_039]|nr:hypothetical protein [Trichormus sp. M33_DOE_039]